MPDRVNIEVVCPRCERPVALVPHPERPGRMYAVCTCSGRPFLERDAFTVDVTDEYDPLDAVMLDAVPGIGREVARVMFHAGFRTLADVETASDTELLMIAGLGPVTLENIRSYVHEAREK